MSAADSQRTHMEDQHAVQDQEGRLTDAPSAGLPAFPNTARPSFGSDAEIENKAASMASNNCSSALSSPAEASPAKPAGASPTTLEGSFETSPSTSQIASASDSLTHKGSSFVDVEALPLATNLLPATFACPDAGKDFPSVLTFKGVSVTLENNSVWKQFHSYGTEMIITKQGRRMFPYCRYRLSGLDPNRGYNLVLSIVPSDQHRYRWNLTKWEVIGRAEHNPKSIIRAFSHHYSPCRGSEGMNGLVSFYKLKLTNHEQDDDDHIVLQSMHRYIPRLHIIPIPNMEEFRPDQPLVVGLESMTFTFPQTEFVAVTTYQNFRITQLKINHNPFAKGFREDGNNSRLQRVTAGSNAADKEDCKPVDLRIKTESTVSSPPKEQETRLILKPFTFSPTSQDESLTRYSRGGHSLGVLVLVKKGTAEEPKKEEDLDVDVTPNKQKCNRQSPKTPTPRSSPGLHKRKKKIKRHWGNSRGREWKAAAASPSAAHSPSTVAMQPELDDVEGLLFVSFTSKEDLEIHVKDMPANTVSPPVSSKTPMDLKETEAEVAETEEERMSRLEAELLKDLKVLRHQQVIHPVLQKVGLKLSLLDPFKSVDLHYLGVRLPLPPPELPSRGSAATTAARPADEGLPYISRTGKTSDMTKIKGWRNKFVKSQEAPPSNPDGSQKNLSAFCSNMLDEYLENEARQISERADAFSANPEAPVAYQLPAKSASYVKTLDSALRHRNAASKASVDANKPCPLSHKPPSYTASTSASPPKTQPGPEPGGTARSPKTSTWGKKPVSSFGQGLYVRNHGLTKFQPKLMIMESKALQQGLHRTQLSAERLSAALTSVLTKEMQSKEVPKRHIDPKSEPARPACAQMFCRLGCVCFSIHFPSLERHHCCHPECMFDSACLRTKSTEQQNQHIQPAASNTGLVQNVRPHLRSRSKKLWNPNMTDMDPEPLAVPKPSKIVQVPAKPPKRRSAPHINQPIREEDKDPVYKYFESMMTCARVRGYNGRPPPETPEEASDTEMSTPSAPEKSAATESQPRKYRVVLQSGDGGNDTHTKRQIEIQSACQWEADSKMVIWDLCQRLNQNRLSEKFCVGPYLIHPITRIAMKKATGSSVTFRVHICKKPLASEDGDDSEEEASDYGSFREDMDEEEEEERMQYGVLPFLSRVLPAGRLTAKRKPVGCQASGLIQVNRKSYNHARLLLGRMGSLHPANRLAAYVTGRLSAPSCVARKTPQRPESPHRAASAGGPHIKTAGAAAPAIIPSKKATDLKMSTQPPVGLSDPASLNKGFISLPSHPQSPESTSPAPTFAPSRSSWDGLFCSSSVPSSVSFSVSPSLKSPSFLGDSGTYSFRICPPDSKGKRGQNLPGVSLPGGFTLIHLPRPDADGASRTRPGNVSATGTAKGARGSRWSVENETKPSEESADTKTTASHQDSLSEDEGSDFSDYSDSDDSIVDIETVNQETQGNWPQKEALESSRDKANRANQPVIIMDLGYKIDDFLMARRHAQTKHSALERRRRTEQRSRFLKLQSLLNCDDKIPRLHLLEMAVEEVKQLRETSKELEETKTRLAYMQLVYVKQLALLSGRPEELIKDKLQSICEGEKAGEKLSKFRPFSQLLQFRAAILQSSGNQPRVPPAPLLPPDVFLPQFQTEMLERASNPSAGQAPAKTSTPAPNSLPPPTGLFSSQSKVATPPAQAVTQLRALNRLQAINQNHFNKLLSAQQQSASSPQHKSKLEGPILPAVLSAIARCNLENLIKSKANSPAATPQPLAAPNTTPTPSTTLSRASVQSSTPSVRSPIPSIPSKTSSQQSSTPKNPRPSFPRPVHLPLVRSKTGRLILPSSLKPVGQGQLKLMFLDSKSRGEERNDTHSSKNQERSADSEGGANAERGRTEEGETQQPSLLATLQTMANQTLGLIQDPETTPANSPPAKQAATPAEPDSTDSSPIVVRRQRGRPRKNTLTPVSQDEKQTLEKDASANESESEASALVDTSQNDSGSEHMTLEVSRTEEEEEGAPEGIEGKQQVLVKRRRGRPPKKHSAAKLQSPQVVPASDQPSKRYKDRTSPDFKTPRSRSQRNLRNASPKELSGTSRPLTRGSLGKDFPSAKKRSWVDMEKELESL